MKPANEKDKNKKAIIYCRVSSASQVAKGDGLNSQASRCREYARYKGYEVVNVYQDKAISGGVAVRPGLDSALTFLRRQKDRTNYVMLFDDISRIARDLRLFLDLRDTADKLGIRLESPMMTFDNSSGNVMSGNIQAVFAEHQRLQNAEQTRNRMEGRARNGYWVFHAPPGYKYEKVEGHGNLLVRDEPLASIIQEALEGFAAGRFETQSEVKRFLESQPDFPKDFADGTIRYEKVVRLFRRVHYAGHIEIPDWGVSLRKGHHEGLISLEAFEKIQKRVKEDARAPARKDLSADFPLRGFITCGDCNKPLTANWSKSKTGKKHPYYMCFSKGCESYRKSIRRDVLEGEFEAMVQTLQPEQGLFACAKAMFKHAWNQRLAQSQAITHALKRDITRIEKQMDTLMDRLVDATTPTAVIAYEARLEKLERQKLVLTEKT
ncbi:MAG: recombinase family protein, partial [Planctomycetaceae bacterium]|nr:recombinase family protein [Planctomycetaceae bacterium]